MWTSQADLLKKYILDCMTTAGSDTVKTAINTFSARKGSQRLIVDDEELLPDDYVESLTQIINKVKSDELKKALQSGIAIKGAHLETGPRSLAVR